MLVSSNVKYCLLYYNLKFKESYISNLVLNIYIYLQHCESEKINKIKNSKISSNIID